MLRRGLGGAEAPPIVRFIGDKPRSTVFKLEWPIEVDGVAYAGITLKRMTAGDVATFMETLRDMNEKARDDVRFPILFHRGRGGAGAGCGARRARRRRFVGADEGRRGFFAPPVPDGAGRRFTPPPPSGASTAL